MRFIIVLADITEVEAQDIVAAHMKAGAIHEPVFRRDIAGTPAFVRAELTNNRVVDKVFFVTSNLYFVPFFGTAALEIEQHPATRHIDVSILSGGKLVET